MTALTNAQITNLSDAAIAAALTAFGLPAATDSRLAIQEILSLLVADHNAVLASNPALITYTANLNRNNIDIDTQRQTFTFTVDMLLVPTGVHPEASLAV